MTRFIILITASLAFVLPVAAHGHTLRYGKARAAAQKSADAFAGQRTEVDTIMRQTRHRYYAQGKWERVEQELCRGCGLRWGGPEGFTPIIYDTSEPTTRYCSAELSVAYRSRSHSRRNRRVVARVTGHACF